jgi:hypothetical protein
VSSENREIPKQKVLSTHFELRNNNCFAYNWGEESMSAATNVSKGEASGFARQVGNLSHRH